MRLAVLVVPGFQQNHMNRNRAESNDSTDVRQQLFIDQAEHHNTTDMDSVNGKENESVIENRMDDWTTGFSKNEENVVSNIEWRNRDVIATFIDSSGIRNEEKDGVLLKDRTSILETVEDRKFAVASIKNLADTQHHGIESWCDGVSNYQPTPFTTLSNQCSDVVELLSTMEPLLHRRDEIIVDEEEVADIVLPDNDEALIEAGAVVPVMAIEGVDDHLRETSSSSDQESSDRVDDLLSERIGYAPVGDEQAFQESSEVSVSDERTTVLQGNDTTPSQDELSLESVLAINIDWESPVEQQIDIYSSGEESSERVDDLSEMIECAPVGDEQDFQESFDGVMADNEASASVIESLESNIIIVELRQENGEVDMDDSALETSIEPSISEDGVREGYAVGVLGKDDTIELMQQREPVVEEEDHLDFSENKRMTMAFATIVIVDSNTELQHQDADIFDGLSNEMSTDKLQQVHAERFDCLSSEKTMRQPVNNDQISEQRIEEVILVQEAESLSPEVNNTIDVESNTEVQQGANVVEVDQESERLDEVFGSDFGPRASEDSAIERQQEDAEITDSFVSGEAFELNHNDSSDVFNDNDEDGHPVIVCVRSSDAFDEAAISPVEILQCSCAEDNIDASSPLANGNRNVDDDVPDILQLDTNTFDDTIGSDDDAESYSLGSNRSPEAKSTSCRSNKINASSFKSTIGELSIVLIFGVLLMHLFHSWSNTALRLKAVEPRAFGHVDSTSFSFTVSNDTIILPNATGFVIIETQSPNVSEDIELNEVSHLDSINFTPPWQIELAVKTNEPIFQTNLKQQLSEIISAMRLPESTKPSLSGFHGLYFETLKLVPQTTIPPARKNEWRMLLPETLVMKLAPDEKKAILGSFGLYLNLVPKSTKPPLQTYLEKILSTIRAPLNLSKTAKEAFVVSHGMYLEAFTTSPVQINMKQLLAKITLLTKLSLKIYLDVLNRVPEQEIFVNRMLSSFTKELNKASAGLHKSFRSLTIGVAQTSLKRMLLEFSLSAKLSDEMKHYVLGFHGMYFDRHHFESNVETGDRKKLFIELWSTLTSCSYFLDNSVVLWGRLGDEVSSFLATNHTKVDCQI